MVMLTDTSSKASLPLCQEITSNSIKKKEQKKLYKPVSDKASILPSDPMASSPATPDSTLFSALKYSTTVTDSNSKKKNLSLNFLLNPKQTKPVKSESSRIGSTLRVSKTST